MRQWLGSSRTCDRGARWWLLLVCVSIAAAWLAPREARACSCMPPPEPRLAMQQADAVFEARAFTMSTDDRWARYRFEVDRVWKGDVGPRVEIKTALHSATCGRSYRIGTRYVIYARRGTDGLSDGLCSRTRTSVSAAEDLQVLGPGRSPDEPAAPSTDPATMPTEPPRIDMPAPEPPPVPPGRRGCAVEKPHAPRSLAVLVLLGLGVAIGRRRTVRSRRDRRRSHDG